MKLVFLDRDGVLNREPGERGYVTLWQDFHFLPRALESVALLTQSGFEINILSNQGGVSHHLLTETELNAITQKMLEAIRLKGGEISGVFYCPHKTADNCLCKKPKTGLFEKALRGRDPGILKQSYFIGDSESDVESGRRVGCQTVLVLSGKSKKEDVGRFLVKPDVVHQDLWEAANWILKKS